MDYVFNFFIFQFDRKCKIYSDCKEGFNSNTYKFSHCDEIIFGSFELNSSPCKRQTEENVKWPQNAPELQLCSKDTKLPFGNFCLQTGILEATLKSVPHCDAVVLTLESFASLCITPKCCSLLLPRPHQD